MDPAHLLTLAFVALFYWMGFGALRAGRIRVKAGTFSRADHAPGFCFFVSVYLLLGTALLVKVLMALV